MLLKIISLCNHYTLHSVYEGRVICEKGFPILPCDNNVARDGTVVSVMPSEEGHFP